MKNIELVIVGGGPAGLAAAIEAKENGIDDILVIERDRELGGILFQCIHNGFGLHLYKDEYTGPEYAEKFIEELKVKGISYLLDTMVIDLKSDNTVVAINSIDGVLEIKAKAVILAMGCRERTRGAISIPGTRPAGVITAGTAQRYINMEGCLVGKKVIVLGSGDIGLIMARRLTLEGAEVKAVLEIMPYSGGLLRNISQCLDDYDIPLLLNHTVIDVLGANRINGVVVSKVDKNLKPIKGTEKKYDCDTLLLSVGLIPENELSKKAEIILDSNTNGLKVNKYMETSNEGVFACGNVVHVHDVVDYVSEEGRKAGKSAAEFLKNKTMDFDLSGFKKNKTKKVSIEEKIEYFSNRGKSLKENEREIICIACPIGCKLKVIKIEDQIIVEDNGCNKGEKYGKDELIQPKRILTSTMKIKNSHLNRIPIRTEKPIPKEMIFKCMEIINNLIVSAPIKKGDVIIRNIENTEVNIIASRTMIEVRSIKNGK